MASLSMSPLRVPLVYDSQPEKCSLPSSIETQARNPTQLLEDIQMILEGVNDDTVGRDFFVTTASVEAFLFDNARPVRVVCLTAVNLLEHVEAICKQRGDGMVQVYRRELGDLLLPDFIGSFTDCKEEFVPATRGGTKWKTVKKIAQFVVTAVGGKIVDKGLDKAGAAIKHVYDNTTAGQVITTVDNEGRELSYTATVRYKETVRAIVVLPGPASPPNPVTNPDGTQ